MAVMRCDVEAVMSVMLGYEEVAALLGRSVPAVRNMKLRGQLPEPDAPGPRWRPETIDRWQWSQGGALDEASSPEPEPEEPPAVAAGDGPVDGPVDASAPARPAVAATPEAAPQRKRRLSPLSRPAGERGDLVAWAARVAREQLACPHPKRERKSFVWGTSCGRCGLLGGAVEAQGGWDREPGSLPG
jgi:hypothetical protein